jgi:hypothetical protein
MIRDMINPRLKAMPVSCPNGSFLDSKKPPPITNKSIKEKASMESKDIKSVVSALIAFDFSLIFTLI